MRVRRKSVREKEEKASQEELDVTVRGSDPKQGKRKKYSTHTDNATVRTEGEGERRNRK